MRLPSLPFSPRQRRVCIAMRGEDLKHMADIAGIARRGIDKIDEEVLAG